MKPTPKKSLKTNYCNINEASKGTGLTIEQIQWIKDRGDCEGIRSSRYYRSDLLKYWKKNQGEFKSPPPPEPQGEQTKEQLEIAKLKAQVEGLNMRMDKEKENLLSASLVREAYANAAQMINDVLTQFLQDKKILNAIIREIRERAPRVLMAK